MNITETISAFVANTTFKDIPSDVVQVAKEFVLDSVGVQLTGASEPVVKIVREFVQQNGGTPEAGVVGGGFKSSVANAVYVNGTANHAPELEACGNFAGSNPLSIIPVALAIGEKMKASGKEVLEAIVVGFEVQGKMGLGTTPGAHNKGWCAIAVHGTIGAVATAAKLLKLNVDQTRMAFGIAASQASGLMRQFGSMTHLLEGGFACRNGVSSAIMAQMGLTADNNIFDGPGNFWNTFVGEGDYSPNVIIKDLGDPFYFKYPSSSIKKYPCCFFTHRAIEALLHIIRNRNITYQEIENVEAGVTPFLKNALVGGPHPNSGEKARFSLEHCLASIILDGDVSVKSFKDEVVISPRLKDARGKVFLKVHPEWPSGRSALVVPITVKLKNGSIINNKVETLKGTADFPLSLEEQINRYHQLAQPILSESQAERTAQWILNLDKLENVNQLMNMVTFFNSES